MQQPLDKELVPDIFLWANQADAHKNELEIDLFLFTKGYTVYATNYTNELKAQLRVLFLYDMISTVQTGAATGMSVRDLSEENDGNVLWFTYLENVVHAQEVIEQIAYGEESLEVFSEGDHEIRKVKGIIARFSVKGSEPFYVVKHLPQSSIMRGATAWALNGTSLQSFPVDAGIKISSLNEVLVVGNQIFAFSEPKFAQLFGYDAKKEVLLLKNIARIEEHFNLKYPEGVNLKYLADTNAGLAKLIIDLEELDMIDQDALVEVSDEYGIELLTDDAAHAIIIMDAKDGKKLLNLIHDNYTASDLTGSKYLTTNKKDLSLTGDGQREMDLR